MCVLFRLHIRIRIVLHLLLLSEDDTCGTFVVIHHFTSCVMATKTFEEVWL